MKFGVSVVSSVESQKAFPGLDYDALEAAVMESSRGRWFLEEFAKRNRNADTRTLLEAIHKLENAVLSHSVASPSGDSEKAELAGLLETIRRTRAEIAAVRNHFLPDGGAIEDDEGVYRRLTETARTAADSLMSSTESIHGLSKALKATAADSPQVAEIDGQASKLQALAWEQDVLSQRIAKAMGLLAHLDERIAGAAGSKVRSAGPPAPPAGQNLPYFIQDEEIFEPVERKADIRVVSPASSAASDQSPDQADPAERRATLVIRRLSAAAEQPVQTPNHASSAPAEITPPSQPQSMNQPNVTGNLATEPERKRVVIIRRKTSETAEIPLANDVPSSAVN
jgi:hypothetical protein